MCIINFNKIALLVLFFGLVQIEAAVPASLDDEKPDKQTDLLQEKAVKVYLDVESRYINYIKTEIPFVNYVRDRKQAEVYLMITDQRTASGGKEFTIRCIGQNGLEGINNTLTFHTKQLDTEDIIRSGLIRRIKIGLIPYILQTPQSKHIDIVYEKETDPTDVTDPWNAWVMTFDIDIDLEGEESKDERDIDAFFSADRIVPESKISLFVSSDYRRDRYKNGGYLHKSIRRYSTIRGLYVKSLSDHWSVGSFGSLYASTYSNIKRQINVAPAVEYNIFPYSDYTEREFRILYHTGIEEIIYEEETLYDKTYEILYYENLTATFELKRRWGTLRAEMEGSHYFHDFSKGRLEFSSNLDLMLFEGFSLNIDMNFSMIRDQLSLPKADATREEILLNRRQIATDYEYDFSFGIRYTFGSIYSNVVNPRFGD